MRNSVQLNVDIHVVTLYGSYMNVPEKSRYQDYYYQVFSMQRDV